MTAKNYDEDALVQQTTADYLHDELGWDSIFAYNEETFGPEGTLGRKNDKEVVLTRYLGEALVKLNPGLPDEAYHDAIRQITEYSFTQSLTQINQEKYELLKKRIKVNYRDQKGDLKTKRLRVFDFDTPTENHFLCVRELWISGSLYRRRTDIVGFVNGIPLLFMELKNLHRDIKAAYEENLADYMDNAVIPHLFHHNAFIVLANGVDAKMGSLTSKFEHYHEWKRLDEDEPGLVDMETLLKGICNKNVLMDLFENFILFDDSSGKLVKIVARNHQYLGVNKSIQAVRDRKERDGKLGVFWHTQGSGKSYSIVFFSRKVHRKLGGNYTFLICTDRDDLDRQIFKTFAGCGVVNADKDKCRAGSGDNLRELLNQHKAYVFTLVQKFNKKIDPENPYSDRDDIIVITDEAHRTQYGLLAMNMRDALPNASYIGFTGTPLFSDDEITRRIFGGYISTYDFQRAVDDNATVPLYYDARGDKLKVTTTDLNKKVADKLAELEIDDIDVAQRLEAALRQDYHTITAQPRLTAIARDFVTHYSSGWETGKAMFVCIDKITCVKMYNLIEEFWQERISELEKQLPTSTDEQDEIYRLRQIAWMKECQMAVVISEEQGEVERFKKWGLDIIPHRKLIKKGYETEDGQRIDLENAFKKDDHPLRVTIVCAMWLTGFDVPTLSTLYLDKPLKAHTLMQAIARANRIAEEKNNGLIVDYCGILKNLRKALATFAGHQGSDPVDGDGPQIDPVKPADEDLLADLDESISLVAAFLKQRSIRLEDVVELTSFAKNKAINDAKEAANENDETRKRFEIMARAVFKKFKACFALDGVRKFRNLYEAISIIYKSLQKDREKADISDIIRQLHGVVDEAIDVSTEPIEDSKLYDISKIDFDKLRKEFETSDVKNTTVQTLKEAIDNKLRRMLQQNPLRTDFQQHYEKIVAEYNQEKDRATIERTFEALLVFVKKLDEEEGRAVREGLNEESLALYDLLKKPDLSKQDIAQIKKVAAELLMALQDEFKRINNWKANQATRDAIQVTISDFLWADETGLPVDSYSEKEVKEKAGAIYGHVFQIHSQPFVGNGTVAG